MLEFALNRTVEVDGAPQTVSICIMHIDDTDPSVSPVVLQPIDGESLAIVRKVLNDIDAAQAAAREAWA